MHFDVVYATQLLAAAIILNSSSSLENDEVVDRERRSNLPSRTRRPAPWRLCKWSNGHTDSLNGGTTAAAKLETHTSGDSVAHKRAVGSPTECALLELTQELGFNFEYVRRQQLLVFGDVSKTIK